VQRLAMNANYRSTPSIVAHSNALIAYNYQHPARGTCAPKALQAAPGTIDNRPVQFVRYSSKEAQGQHILACVKWWHEYEYGRDWPHSLERCYSCALVTYMLCCWSKHCCQYNAICCAGLQCLTDHSVNSNGCLHAQVVCSEGVWFQLHRHLQKTSCCDANQDNLPSIVTNDNCCRGLARPSRCAEGSRGALQPDQDSGSSQVAAVPPEGRLEPGRAKAPCGSGGRQCVAGRC